jgi:hypothetical protein
MVLCENGLRCCIRIRIYVDHIAIPAFLRRKAGIIEIGARGWGEGCPRDKRVHMRKQRVALGPISPISKPKPLLPTDFSVIHLAVSLRM